MLNLTYNVHMLAILNKQAIFDYQFLDKFEAGLVLFGHEVKSVKNGGLNLKGAYITVRHVPKIELFLTNANISLYKKAGALPDYNPTRPRKLLVTKKEINSIIGKIEQKGLTIVPIKVYTKRNLIKLEFAIAKGKKQYQKKEIKKKRDIDREIYRTLKSQR